MACPSDSTTRLVFTMVAAPTATLLLCSAPTMSANGPAILFRSPWIDVTCTQFHTHSH